MDAAIATSFDSEVESLDLILRDGAVAFEWLTAYMQTLEQKPLVVRHHFAPGVYVREMLIPAGTLLIGATHLFEHACTCSGDIDVWTLHDGKVFHVRMTGWFDIVSKAGAQRVGLARADTVFSTSHPNPDNCRDIEALELRIVGRVIDPMFKVSE
jgi:hypothetical protein